MDRLGNVTDEETIMSMDKAGHIYRNFTKPPKKDTVTVPDGGYTIVRFHATNPGNFSLKFKHIGSIPEYSLRKLVCYHGQCSSQI